MDFETRPGTVSGLSGDHPKRLCPASGRNESAGGYGDCRHSNGFWVRPGCITLFYQKGPGIWFFRPKEGWVVKQPFTRKDLATDGCSVLRKGRWANADLYLYKENDVAWVVKDFLPCAPIVRKTWGRFLVQREFHALDRLQGVAGIPQAPFIIDAHALGYRYIPGRTLRDTPSELIDASFFKQLEKLVEEMHKRNMVHLDSRNRRNVLIT